MSGKMLVFDVESTGTDVFNDRIVQLFIGIADEAGDLIGYHEWIIDPGVDVPDEVAAIHGFTTAYLRENGMDPVDALNEIREVFLLHRNLPVVAFNINYDLTILDAEFKRYGITETFGTHLRDNVRLFDGLVIDRAKDKYRKGKRKLVNMAAHYGIPFDEDAAHKADYDVEVTAKVTKAILDKFGTPTNAEQARWYKDWAEHLQEYLRKTDPAAEVDSAWPLREGK